jgi:hypothetical protein
VFHRLTQANVEAVIYGGWLRDTCWSELHGPREYLNRDIDVVTSGISLERLRTLVGPSAGVTMLGGLICQGATMSFDIWPLERSFFLEHESRPKTFEALLGVTDFNINALLLRAQSLGGDGRLLELGALDGIASSIIDFQHTRLAFPEVQAARLLIYAAKLDAAFSASVSHFLESWIRQPLMGSRIADNLRNYCPASLLPKAMERLKRIISL